ncbi:MAG: 4Fe-4S dicluster domain-containing protein [Thermoplasmatales archaeon]|nr:MAG: 4Fe-4S dicluster domain-containing protein [Thermoplasmatales archaeon]
MSGYILSKDNLPKFITEIMGKNKVFAPVEVNDETYFKEIKNPKDINMKYDNSKLPPKSLLFCQTETLFKFTPGTKVKIQPPDINNSKKAIFGIRPCDAKSFFIIDPVFKEDFEDPFYVTRRDNMLLVGLSCTNPYPNCFCTSFNDSPASSKHVDILLTDIGEKYFVEVNSEKGKKIVKSSLFKPATKADETKKKEVEKKAVNSITRFQKIDKIDEKLDKIFENHFWKEIADKCLRCGTCTYLCPTCHCFDIQDESTMIEGGRVRIWDTCMIPEYTLQASGYNPRPTRANRVRNRVYHKYNYYPKNLDVIACVGCGRCIEGCPVNIDIIDVVTRAGEVKP